jgi:hypothetical protein
MQMICIYKRKKIRKAFFFLFFLLHEASVRSFFLLLFTKLPQEASFSKKLLKLQRTKRVHKKNKSISWGPQRLDRNKSQILQISTLTRISSSPQHKSHSPVSSNTPKVNHKLQIPNKSKHLLNLKIKTHYGANAAESLKCASSEVLTNKRIFFTPPKKRFQSLNLKHVFSSNKHVIHKEQQINKRTT